MNRRSLAVLLFGLGTWPALAQAQTCADVAACRALVEGGRYEGAERALVSMRGPDARLLLGRVYLETGRYQEAAELARPLARGGVERVAAATLLGEAELARGRLDEAERALGAVAQEPTAHRARIVLGRALLRRGRAAQAQGPLMAVIGAYNDSTIPEGDAEGLAYVGMAAAMLDAPHDANDALLESMRADPRRVETQLALAELFLGYYDVGRAEESLNDALAANPSCARAHALMARVKLEQSIDFDAAGEALGRALAINPNLVMAHVTRASIAVRDMDLALAHQHLDRALAIDPTDLEALSVRAAVRFLEDDTRGFAAATRAVLAQHPRYSRMYSIIAEYADWEHRYPQIVEMARTAIQLDPTDARAQATLGINLLRMGEEEEGLAALRRAWERDRFNVRVYNILNLFERTLGTEYERVEAGPIVFRMHRAERPVMERTATRTLRRAWDDMRRRYRFTPRTPVHIEMFSDPQHFSVRTAGLPNVGVQGVCFGQVVTALSPSAGPFNWAQITWHELAHVFHIQLSENRVPRWFTEGLAEYETLLARPEWRREEDHRLYPALAAGRFPHIRNLTHAFTHARSGEDITVAYYGSSMLVKYIAERFGFERVPRMLREWARGRSTDEVVQRVLGVDLDALDRDFREHELGRMAARADDFAVDFAAYRDLDAVRARAEQAPDDAAAQAELAAALHVAGQAGPSLEAVRRALRIDADQPIARFVGARLAVARREPRTAMTDLDLLIRSGHDGYEPRLMQARLALARHDREGARAALEAARRIDPSRPEAHQGLLELAPDDAAARVPLLRRLVDVDQHDRDANFALLEALAEAEDWAGVRELGERALYVDPLRAEARRLYAEGLLRGDDAAEALAQADQALTARPERPGPVHLTRARALAALRRTREAREAAAEATRADPALAEAARALGL